MARRSKTFQKGGRIPEDRLGIGSLEPDEWSEEFLATLGAWKEDIERPRSIAIAKSDVSFDA